jgi:hypothetical protein
MPLQRSSIEGPAAVTALQQLTPSIMLILTLTLQLRRSLMILHCTCCCCCWWCCIASIAESPTSASRCFA